MGFLLAGIAETAWVSDTCHGVVLPFPFHGTKIRTCSSVRRVQIRSATFYPAQKDRGRPLYYPCALGKGERCAKTGELPARPPAHRSISTRQAARSSTMA